MIDIDKLRSINHLVTHAGCPDGIASALIIKDALPDVKVSFMNYGSKEHRELAPEPGMLFCDFAPHIEREVHDSALVGGPAEHSLKPWLDAGAIVLDHHPTAKDVVEMFGKNGVFGLNEKNECGAWLAYEHVWKVFRGGGKDQLEVEHFAALAAIRDTWKKKDPRWQQSCEQAAALLFWPFEDLSIFSVLGYNNEVGPVLVAKQRSSAQRSLNESFHFSTRLTNVIMFQGVSATSDAVELLPNPAFPMIVVGFHYRWDVDKLQLQFSLRSHTGFDCASFAKAHGGGGHRAAAGFTLDVSPELSANPYQAFRLLLEQWESS